MSSKPEKQSCTNLWEVVSALQTNKYASALITVFDTNTLGSIAEAKSSIQQELLNNSDSNIIDRCIRDPKFVAKLKKHFEKNELVHRILDDNKVAWINKKLALDEYNTVFRNFIDADEITKSNIELLFGLRWIGEFGEKWLEKTDAPAFELDNRFSIVRKDDQGKFTRVFTSQESYKHSDGRENHFGQTRFGEEGVMENEFKIQTTSKEYLGSYCSGIIRYDDATKTYIEVFFSKDTWKILPFGLNGDKQEALLRHWHYNNEFVWIVRRFEDGTYKNVAEWMHGGIFSKLWHMWLPSNELIKKSNSDNKLTILRKTEQWYEKMFTLESACHLKGFGEYWMDKDELLCSYYSAWRISTVRILRRGKDGIYRFVLNSRSDKWKYLHRQFKSISWWTPWEKVVTYTDYNWPINVYMKLDKDENYVIVREGQKEEVPEGFWDGKIKELSGSHMYLSLN